MDDLPPKARALVDAGRGALRATDGDRARIEAALRARLGEGALPHEPASTPGSRWARWHAVAKVAVGVVVVAGAVVVAVRPASNAPVPARAVQRPLPAMHQPASVSDAAPTQPTPTPAVTQQRAPVRKAPPESAPHGADRLAQEVALLSRATAQLRAGHAKKALMALDEHQRRFPQGALSEDRRAAKAQALCLTGQVAKGRAELALLPALSPAAARSEQVCATGSLTTTSAP